MPTPRYTPIIRELPSSVPFVGPEAQERASGKRFRARIGANESVFGPSPKAVAAMQAAAADMWMYCDPDNYDLKQVVSRHHGVSADNVVIIEGIDGGLGLANRLVVSPGEAVITSDGAYPTFNFHVAASGGRLVKVPYHDDREDLGALLDAAKAANAPLLYVSNPDNPMGSWWPADEIQRMIAALPGDTLLLLDEAYVDTAPEGTAPPIDVSNPQVLRFRTFSKAYGLAGIRVGYAIGETGVIANFEKVRNHYGINRLGQVAGLAAIEDQAYLRQAVARISGARDRIGRIGQANGLQPLPSATNFVTLDCGRDAAHARAIMQALLDRGVFVRMPAVAPLNRCIRIGAGRDEDLAILEAELPVAIAQASGM
ncbi:MAG: pyridoxal phosphate-dependent aminotransferase [Hyphomicrobiaceae bacterium]|nr:pyridoxal phosphate-dependent aminotransferase [Hyphomicrobiaceae bacterium]